MMLVSFYLVEINTVKPGKIEPAYNGTFLRFRLKEYRKYTFAKTEDFPLPSYAIFTRFTALCLAKLVKKVLSIMEFYLKRKNFIVPAEAMFPFFNRKPRKMEFFSVPGNSTISHFTV